MREDSRVPTNKNEPLLGEIPEGLTGSGLEFIPAVVGGGKKLYLDGKFIVVVTSDAQFSQTPTNGRVIAWLIVERIDYCPIKGSQMRWNVVAWREGCKKPKIVFEDHAYDYERSLSVDAPVVREDGTIIVTVWINGEKSTHERTLA